MVHLHETVLGDMSLLQRLRKLLLQSDVALFRTAALGVTIHLLLCYHQLLLRHLDLLWLLVLLDCWLLLLL